MFTFSNRNGASLLGSGLQLDEALSNIRHKTTIELLRLRGRFVDSHSELDIIQAELNRRQRWERLAYTLLITGVVLFIGVFVYV